MLRRIAHKGSSGKESLAAYRRSVASRAPISAPVPHAASCRSQSAATCGARSPAAKAAATPASAPAAASAADDTPAPSVRAELRRLFSRAIAAAFPDAPADVALVPCANPKFGDYQCNNAMAIFGKLKGSPGAPKNPRAVAEAILAALDAPNVDLIDETSLAGPGFINIKLSRAWLAAHVHGILQHGVRSVVAPVHKRVVVDFSSPNVAKEMHVGHLRSTIIGDTICNALELCGADVVRLNHVGDWGTQFGMLIQFMREREGGLEADGAEAVSDLMKLYKASKARFDKDEGFKTRSREAVTKLQSGDPESLKAWGRICEASRREFDAIYRRLDVKLEERGESFYNPQLPATVEALAERGIIADSDGAKVVWTERKDGVPPLMVQKSDGGFGYASTDMAAIRQRLNEEKADWIIYVTDVGQAQHFAAIFKAARMAGWLPEDPAQPPRVDHVGFGLVLGEDGKRFRTRSSEVVRLVDLLDEAKDRCAQTMRERRAESGEPVDEAELETAAAALGYGAVKYADLKNSRTTNYKFDFDAMLALKGNTAVYLLYAHARIAGIVRKGGKDIDDLAASATITFTSPYEEALALHLAKFPEAVEDTLEELMPNRLTEYLYSLSEAFNSFYTECKVIGSPEEDARLLLCETSAIVMRACFQLLGITPLYRI
eukprot:jgi/Ulvmu1/10062/UM006_0009.1